MITTMSSREISKNSLIKPLYAPTGAISKQAARENSVSQAELNRSHFKPKEAAATRPSRERHRPVSGLLPTYAHADPTPRRSSRKQSAVLTKAHRLPSQHTTLPNKAARESNFLHLIESNTHKEEPARKTQSQDKYQNRSSPFPDSEDERENMDGEFLSDSRLRLDRTREESAKEFARVLKRPKPPVFSGKP